MDVDVLTLRKTCLLIMTPKLRAKIAMAAVILQVFLLFHFYIIVIFECLPKNERKLKSNFRFILSGGQNAARDDASTSSDVRSCSSSERGKVVHNHSLGILSARLFDERVPFRKKVCYFIFLKFYVMCLL